MIRAIGIRCVYAILVFWLPGAASAGKILDSIRSYDLNNYALGINFSVSQRPYTNAENSAFAYPYLTSFEYQGFTDDWLLIAEGDLGIRKVTESQWVFGLVGRIQTLGFGSEKPDELMGMEDKQWTVELAPFVAYRGWPVHISAKPYKEISGRHGGWIGEFRLEWPLQRSWGYIVPSITASRLDDTYANYYYGVTPQEARPGRPPYTPGAATNLTARLTAGVQLSDKWLLSGHFEYEKLDAVISNSPIVDKDSLWSGGIGIAYNADVFRSRVYGADTYKMPRFEFRVGYFNDNITTEITLDAEDGSPGEPIDLEDRLDAEDSKYVLQVDAIIRFNAFNRLEFGYFDLSRESSITLQNDIDFGDETFPAGTNVELGTDVRVARISYGFSLMNDAQKELGVMAGVHVSRLSTELFAPDTLQRERSTATTPLPVVGVFGSVALKYKMFLGAQVQIFRMEFDHYKGSMNFLNLGLQKMLGNHASTGTGDYQFTHKGDKFIELV